MALIIIIHPWNVSEMKKVQLINIVSYTVVQSFYFERFWRQRQGWMLKDVLKALGRKRRKVN